MIGGQTGIIRGGLELPREQAASDLAPQDAHKPPESVLLLPPTCVRQDSELGSDERVRRAESSLCAKSETEDELRVFSRFPDPLGHNSRRSSENLFKGEYFWSDPSDRHGLHVIPETAALVPGECFLHSRPDVQWEAQQGQRSGGEHDQASR